MEIGKRIAVLREKAGLSQRQLAEALGVTQGMIGQIERGTKGVSLQLGKAMAAALNVDILEIIGRD
ncbi:MAG: helix-turn-helix transcriptional regulator [Clostridiales bacterium]|nr:helix-turn-helix transcriptional regulator [Clostridiales bacterium]